MNEKAFTYKNFENLSYFTAAILATTGLISISIFLMPHIEMSLYITIGGLCMAALVYTWARILKFTMLNKSIPQKEQKQILKRYRFSLKWLYVVLGVSISIPLILNLFFGLALLQTIGVFNVLLPLSMFVLLRVFLHTIKNKMNLEPLSS